MGIRSLVQIDRSQLSDKTISLRQNSELVTDFGLEFQEVVDDLIETFWHHRIAVGLAAPQIGINIQLAVVNATRDANAEMLVLVNPVVISESGKKDLKKESCMSVPHFAGEVERRKKLSVEFQDRFGKEGTLDAEGFLARVIQHEVDHLNGLLYLDRMKDIAKIETTDLFKLN